MSERKGWLQQMQAFWGAKGQNTTLAQRYVKVLVGTAEAESRDKPRTQPNHRENSSGGHLDNL